VASLTVRQLDEKLKKLLRLRAVKNGRSVEDEVRTILRSAAADADAFAPATDAPRQAGRQTETDAPHILLVIGGGIAAYKSLDLIRRLRERGIKVRVVMTAAAQKFITPLSVGAIAGEHPFTDLFDARSEFDVGHIRLARDPSLIVVAPATADLMAKMANGLADDLASAVLLATDKTVLLAPAMNPLMWSNKATRRNLAQLTADQVVLVGPNAGEMAESGEAGVGRMAEPLDIVVAVQAQLAGGSRALSGVRMLVTSGPTHEPIDPVRYIANRSSGKQGFAIAAAARAAGADVTLISGPVDLADPAGVTMNHVESARDMLREVEAALPVDVAIFAAAVADWRVANAGEQKLKKTGHGMPPLQLVENPDILATIAKLGDKRPALVIGFAAETEHLIDNAKAKLARKGCDWIVANDVSPATGVMGGDRNTVHLLTRDSGDISVDTIKVESWPVMTKEQVATELVARIAKTVEKPS
jgi:phosphopantothenoylcysteine decarboxylase/phosphopantothenate--cysteine ligase